MSLAGATPLVLVGAGKMGGAMLAGWLARGLDSTGVVIVDPSPPEEMRAFIDGRSLRHEASSPADLKASVLVVAVKPQIMSDVLPSLRPLLTGDTLVVSIAAGTTIASLAEELGATSIVRAMPNTPAQVGRGMTVAVGTNDVSETQRAIVTELLAAIGEVAWVANEADMDAVTAVSGSGPAYVFHLVEALAAAGRAEGLDADLAMTLARQTVVGAGELMHQSDLDAATLRRNVTSKGGTTAAALEVLMSEEGLSVLMERAVKAAAERSRELGG